MQLSADLFSAGKEAERDMYRQRDSQFQTVMISATVMMGVTAAIIVEGTLPDGSPEWLEISLATFSGFAFSMFVCTIIIAMKVLTKVSRFMYLKAYDQSRGVDHMLRHTDRSLAKIYQSITRYDGDDDEEEAAAADGRSEAATDDEHKGEEIRRHRTYVAKKALGPYGHVLEEILADQRKFHELLLRQHDNTAVRRELAKVTGSFEDYWKTECSGYSRVVHGAFAIGTGALLVSAALYVYGKYVIQYNSIPGAIAFCSMIGIAFAVGAVIVVDIAERKIAAHAARQPPSLRSQQSEMSTKTD